MLRTILFDVDGTLVDSNDAHARAWLDALWEEKIPAHYFEVREKIGMGADQLLPALVGFEADSPIGKRLAARRGEIFRARYLPQLRAFPGAADLLRYLRDTDHRVIAATSASKEDLGALLGQCGLESLLTEYVTGDDVDESKPEPDIVCAALTKARVSADEAVMVGDTPYDIRSAAAADVGTIAFTCGGWPARHLTGAIGIYAGPAHLLEEISLSPLARSPKFVA